jgi:hypothetical protein
MSDNAVKEAAEKLYHARNVVVFTGAAYQPNRESRISDPPGEYGPNIIRTTSPISDSDRTKSTESSIGNTTRRDIPQ